MYFTTSGIVSKRNIQVLRYLGIKVFRIFSNIQNIQAKKRNQSKTFKNGGNHGEQTKHT
jgi:hypothetical protein